MTQGLYAIMVTVTATPDEGINKIHITINWFDIERIILCIKGNFEKNIIFFDGDY